MVLGDVPTLLSELFQFGGRAEVLGKTAPIGRYRRLKQASRTYAVAGKEANGARVEVRLYLSPGRNRWLRIRGASEKVFLRPPGQQKFQDAPVPISRRQVSTFNKCFETLTRP